MVKAVVDLGEHEDRVVTIVKGKFGLKNKSDAINKIIDIFEEEYLEPELRPEYIDEIRNIEKGKFKKYSSIEDLRKEIENV